MNCYVLLLRFLVLPDHSYVLLKFLELVELFQQRSLDHFTDASAKLPSSNILTELYERRQNRKPERHATVGV